MEGLGLLFFMQLSTFCKEIIQKYEKNAIKPDTIVCQKGVLLYCSKIRKTRTTYLVTAI